MNCNQNLTEIKFHINLFSKNNNLTYDNQSNKTAYLIELEKINKSSEPYKSIFGLEDIKLFTYDLENNKLLDHRSNYYQMYVSSKMKISDVKTMVFKYISGIEWLYQYYITGKKMEWSGWYYPYTKPPLIDDVIDFLKNYPNCQEDIIKYLENYPENNMTISEHYKYVTPNEYTGANIAPNLSDVVHLIDGKGASYLNRCQFKWHEL